MCGRMVDIQSPMAEIRQGKKKEETTGQKYNGQGDHNYEQLQQSTYSIRLDVFVWTIPFNRNDLWLF